MEQVEIPYMERTHEMTGHIAVAAISSGRSAV